MTKLIEFTVPGDPRPKKRPRIYMHGRYRVNPSKQDEETFLYQALKYKPIEPLSGPLWISLLFSKIKPQSLPKHVQYNFKKPDVDNLEKLVMDALQGVFYTSDSQFVYTNAAKVYGKKNFTRVILGSMENFKENSLKMLNSIIDSLP